MTTAVTNRATWNPILVGSSSTSFAVQQHALSTRSGRRCGNGCLDRIKRFLPIADTFKNRTDRCFHDARTFMNRASRLFHDASTFMRRANRLLRDASTFMSRASRFIQAACTFMRRASRFMRAASTFMRRASRFMRRNVDSCAPQTGSFALNEAWRAPARDFRPSKNSERTFAWGTPRPERRGKNRFTCAPGRFPCVVLDGDAGQPGFLCASTGCGPLQARCAAISMEIIIHAASAATRMVTMTTSPRFARTSPRSIARFRV